MTPDPSAFNPMLQSSLLGFIFTIAIAVSVSLRAEKTRREKLFLAFTITVGLLYLVQFLHWALGSGELLFRGWLLAAILVPQGALSFFRAFLGRERKSRSRLQIFGYVTGFIALTACVPSLVPARWAGVVVLVYVSAMQYASLYYLYSRSRAIESRVESTRIVYLVVGGTLAVSFSLADYLPYVGVPFPPMGAVITSIFLYIVSQSLFQFRLLDLYELLGRLTVLVALALVLAGIFWGLVMLNPTSTIFFVNAMAAAFVILIVFDPLRALVEQRIGEFFLKERFDFENAIEDTRRRIGRSFDLDEIATVLAEGLRRSGRMTQASFYLIDSEGQRFMLRASLVQGAVPEVGVAAARGLLDRLARDGLVTSTGLQRDLRSVRGSDVRSDEAAIESMLHLMKDMGADVVVPVREGDHTYGLLGVQDSRLKDAFAPEEQRLIGSLAGFVAVAVENTRVYERIKERDRLAAIGEMSAGLAHEIRNPLGSIRAAVEYLTDLSASQGPGPSQPGARGSIDSPAPGRAGQDGAPSDPVEASSPAPPTDPEISERVPEREFMQVIVQEVDRLNRVVTSFLDYARPAREDPEPSQVNAIIERTMKLVRKQSPELADRIVLDLQEGLPAVKVSDDKLGQVFWNLVKNALDATGESGSIHVSTRSVRRRGWWPEGERGSEREFVEVSFRDEGPGIPRPLLSKIFIPFFTTKDGGTGLGLPISQRIVREAGGNLEVETIEGKGSTFTVTLPPAPQTTADIRQ